MSRLEGVRENLGLKILAIALALSAWLMAQGEQVYDSTVVLPVQYAMPEDLVLVTEAPPDRVVIQVSGNRASLRKLQEKLREVEIRYDVDVAAAEPGRTVHSFRTLPAGLPPGVTVRTVSPAEVEIAFDELATRTVPVVLKTRGRLPPGYLETSRSVQPDEVTLTGAAQELTDLDFVNTAPLRLGGRTESFRGEVGLDLGALHLTPGNPSVVLVELTVEEAVAEREFGAIPVEVAAADLSVEPDRCLVRLSGPVPVLDALSNARGVRAVLDGDAGLLPAPGASGVVPWSTTPPSPDAAPAVRVILDHDRASDLTVVAVEPVRFAVLRAEPKPEPAPQPSDGLPPEDSGASDPP